MGENEGWIRSWELIPPSAFLYFPADQDVIVGSGEKQWRKIFQNGQEYTDFQIKELNRLEEKILKETVSIDAWFTRPNKLRFLQANKFKASKTIDSMVEYTKWRMNSFPVKITPKIENLLNSGAFYFCGRDNKYRPIIVADISKFSTDDVDLIPETLVVMMEFMIKNLLIEGQVENYILIMNLEAFTFGLRSVVMKIVSFTSNSYRGRLFASYMLSMPSFLSWGWESFASTFVSQTTLRKIKITGKMINPEMWTHINKNIIQKKYGGNMTDLRDHFWPPRQLLMIYEDQESNSQNKLIKILEYKNLYLQKKLERRKVKLEYIKSVTPQISKEPSIKQPSIKEPQIRQPTVKQPSVKEPTVKQPSVREQSAKQIFIQQPSVHDQQDYLPSYRETVGHVTNKQSGDQKIEAFKIIIRSETSFVRGFRTIKTFFQKDSFRKICKQLPLHSS